MTSESQKIDFIDFTSYKIGKKSNDFTDIKLFFMVPVNATIFIKFDTLSGFESVCKDFISLIYVFVWPKKKKKKMNTQFYKEVISSCKKL